MTATEIINKHWTKDKGGTNFVAIVGRYEHEFNYSMKLAQIELIRKHYPTMDRVKKIRAQQTLRQLEAK